jgi:RNA polymerase sigma-19 factor, ECF subfamily
MSGKLRPPLSATVLALIEVYKEAQQLARARFPRSPDSAEDLLHDVYVTVFERPPLSVDKPIAYLSRALANEAVSSARRRKSERVRFNTQELSRVCETRSELRMRDMADEIAAERELLEFCKQLPPHLSATLLMCKRDRLTYEEAAKCLGVSVATIQKNLAKAIALCIEMDAKAHNRGSDK